MITSLLRDARADVRGRFVGRLVAALDLERHLVRAAVLRPAQRADGAGDARVDVRAGARDDARGERRGVELVLGVQNERGVHRAHPRRRRRAPMQQVQEVPADRVVLGLDRRCAGPSGCSDTSRRASSRARRAAGPRCRARPRRCDRPSPAARSRAPRRRCACTSIGCAAAGSASSDGAHHRGQAAQALQLRLVGRELRAIRQLAVDEQVRDLLELALVRDLEDVVAAIVQIVAGAAHRAQRGVAGDDAGQRDGFLGLRAGEIRCGSPDSWSRSCRVDRSPRQTARRASVRSRDSRARRTARCASA